MPNLFVDDSTVPTRAFQAYLVLIGLAWHRQTVTYGQLSQDYMEYGTGGILAAPLGCIMGWCYEQGLPPLTAIVVNDMTGIPGGGLVTVEGDDFPASQQSVFAKNWFKFSPPTIQELSEAGERVHARTLRKP